MFYVYASSMVVLNVAWLFCTLMGLPGNWLMIGTALLLMWITDSAALSWWTIGAVIGVAVVGEIIELIAGASGSKKAGGTRWGAAGALGGGIGGALFGTVLIPVPVIGTIAGAVIGAFAGSAALELMSGRPHAQALRAGRGAAVGHFIGTMTKFSLGCVIWLVLAIGAFNP
jgi:uncharacterized protein YqgC (DUF456 family)